MSLVVQSELLCLPVNCDQSARERGWQRSAPGSLLTPHYWVLSNCRTVGQTPPHSHHVHPCSSDGRVWQLEAAASEENVQQADPGRQVWRRSQCWETILQWEVLRSGEDRLQGTTGESCWWRGLPGKVNKYIKLSVNISTSDWNHHPTNQILQLSPGLAGITLKYH